MSNEREMLEFAAKACGQPFDAEIAKLKRKDFREMREMLRAMQAGELTVSRGIEILNIWWAGNWNDSMLPPVRQDLIEEDSMPVEIIDRLKQERDQLREQVKVARSYFEAIIDPIAYMRAKLEDGYELNGSMAVQLSQSHTYLKGLAKEALAATEPKL